MRPKPVASFADFGGDSAFGYHHREFRFSPGFFPKREYLLFPWPESNQQAGKGRE
jgi:hypothetical protein